MQIRWEKRYRNYIKKEGLSSRQPNLLLNLKSNTMKNTVQRVLFCISTKYFVLKICFITSFLRFCQVDVAKRG